MDEESASRFDGRNGHSGPTYVADALAKAPAWGVFRRFDWLSTLCLLDYQRTLSQLERKIQSEPEYQNSTKEIKEAKKALYEYSRLIHMRNILLQCREPYPGWTSWLQKKIKTPTTGEDLSWLEKEDLIIVDPTPEKPLIAILTQIYLQRSCRRWLILLSRAPSWLFSMIPSCRHSDGIDHEKQIQILFQSMTDFHMVEEIGYQVATLLTLVITLVPIGLLYFHLNTWSQWDNFGLIIGFSILFQILLYTIKASFIEKCTAAASYSALLIVFLGLTHKAQLS